MPAAVPQKGRGAKGGVTFFREERKKEPVGGGEVR